MKITESDVEYVANLANVEVLDNEKSELAEQLSRILDYVEQLNQLDVSGIQPTSQVVTSERHAVRDDRVAPRTGSSGGRKDGQAVRRAQSDHGAMNLKNLTADKLALLYRNRDVTVTEVVRNLFEEIDRTDPSVRAFITLARDRALEDARQDTLIAAGEPIEPLAGIPVAIRRQHRCPRSAHDVRVKNPAELHLALQRNRGGTVTTSRRYRHRKGGISTSSQWDHRRRTPASFQPGIRTISRESPAGRAPDPRQVLLPAWRWRHSVRTPAARFDNPHRFCGVARSEPTYGRVSRYGLVAFASSLDQIGVFSKTVRDAAQMLEVISGFDHYDSTSADTSVDALVNGLEHPMKDLRIGVPKEYFISGMDPEVREKVEAGIRLFQRLGYNVEQISLPHTEYAVATYYIIANAEASSNLARYDGVRYGFRAEATDLREMYRKTRQGGLGKEVKRRILLGTYALSAG
jgi:aspartyl-tRNA(Asn)/glutamyl-tRNA(Gln) amidotransferase subunit A